MGHLAGVGTGIMVSLEQEYGRLPERERELRGLSVKKRTGIHKLCLSLPVAIYSEKTQNAASPTNLKLYSESIPRFTLSLKEALPLCIGRSYLIECLCLMTGTE